MGPNGSVGVASRDSGATWPAVDGMNALEESAGRAMEQKQRILIGVIGAAQGVKGEVRVQSYTARPTAIGDYGPLAARDGRSFDVLSVRPLRREMVAMRLRGITDRTSAEALNGVELYVDRSGLPPPEAGEFYLADLLGLEAVTADGAALGRVRAVDNHGGGDILAIDAADGREILVPFTKVFVPAVDLGAGRVVVAEAALVSDEAGAN